MIGTFAPITEDRFTFRFKKFTIIKVYILDATLFGAKDANGLAHCSISREATLPEVFEQAVPRDLGWISACMWAGLLFCGRPSDGLLFLN